MRWTIVVLGGVGAVVLAVVLVVNLGDEDTTSATTTSEGATTSSTAAGSTSSGPTTTAVGSVAGKPCVSVTEPLPEGAPEVPVKVGPPPTELITEDLVVGTGKTVEAGATVTVHYIGVACSSGVIFDSSYESKEPATFSLSGVIQGWTEGIPGMKVGGRRLLGIPPDQGYGATGQGTDIRPDEALWFVVELVDISTS